MCRKRRVLAALGAAAAASAAGYVFSIRKSAWQKRETGQNSIEDKDETDFFENELLGDGEDSFGDGQNGADEENSGLFLRPEQTDYMDYSIFLLKKLGNEIRDCSREMYTLVSRRNIKAEEKEKRLKDMAVENMNACHQIADSADGMLGMIRTRASGEFADCFHAMNRILETDEKEAE